MTEHTPTRWIVVPEKLHHGVHVSGRLLVEAARLGELVMGTGVNLTHAVEDAREALAKAGEGMQA